MREETNKETQWKITPIAEQNTKDFERQLNKVHKQNKNNTEADLAESINKVLKNSEKKSKQNACSTDRKGVYKLQEDIEKV